MVVVAIGVRSGGRRGRGAKRAAALAQIWEASKDVMACRKTLEFLHYEFLLLMHQFAIAWSSLHGAPIQRRLEFLLLMHGALELELV